MPIQTPLYPHAFIVPEAYTWSTVGLEVPAAGSVETPTILPGAVVNPNTATYPDAIPSVGHIVCCQFYQSGGTLSALFQFRFPAGTNTWHTALTVAFAAAYLILDQSLEVLYLPCVPNFRVSFVNSGAAPATLEGALTLYSL